MNTDHWPYLLATILVVCGTTVIIISLITDKILPEIFVSAVVLGLGSILSYVYGARKNGANSGKKP